MMEALKSSADLTIRIERRHVKNINIYLKAPYREVLVTAPTGMAQSRIEAFLSEKQDWILKNTMRLRAQYASRPEPTVITAAVRSAYADRLHAGLPGLIAMWEKRLGVSLNSYRLRVMKRCWGVCHCAARTVTFNLYLAEKPWDCIEYVVVHELCHLLEPSHNAHFHALMDRYLPDWRERKRILNQQIKAPSSPRTP